MSNGFQGHDLDPGAVIAFGATNARIGFSHNGDLSGFRCEDTPTQPKEFFSWMARSILEAAESGNSWVVAGFPGPVSAGGTQIGPMANVEGLKESSYDLFHQLAEADSAAGRALDEDITLIPVNDGELSAHAAASRIGEYKYDRSAALIIGTGVGAGIVDKDPRYANVTRANRSMPAEIGHVLMGADPNDTFENRISGTALKVRYGIEAEELPYDHEAWKLVGESAGRMAAQLGIMEGVELVVPCGGVGGNAVAKYKQHLEAMLETYEMYGNETQKMFAPEVLTISPEDTNTFEMYGGEPVMRDFLTQ